MGTDQGKVANLNAFGFLASARGEPVPAIGTTTYRQPYKPVTIGALAGQHAGDHFAPRRGTPMHDWHRQRGAVFEPVGDWLRARAYPRASESFHDAVQREAKAARTTIGVLDATTLGKIDVKGPDARKFLNRVYTNAWMKLAPGRCRYGLMLGEDGMVADDGVTACLADDHFHMTTTTGGAASVLGKLEDYLQTEWPDLKVYLTSVTEQWAVAAICGPQSHKLVGALCDDLDPDPAGFEFMTWRDAHIGGIPVRVFRISFTGELSYEINIPATYGLWLWQLVMEKGAPYGVTPYGTEAMHLLRAEKGFVIVGQETDGTVTPDDLGYGGMAKKSADFIGRRSLSRPDTARTDRKQLVGLLTEDPSLVLMEGAHVIATAAESAPPVPMLGHVTSSYFSPNLERSIAMALVRDGRRQMGERLWVSRRDGAPIPVTVTGTDFLAEGEKGDG
jgi:sarcosine oxidase subunit alpha